MNRWSVFASLRSDGARLSYQDAGFRIGTTLMQFGFYAPNFGFGGDVRALAALARDAEDCGWDGFFLWDHLQFIEPVVDPWMALTAMALNTKSIRLGTLVTPVPRRHIAKLAREAITLDHVSGGRAILGVGAGFPLLPDFAAFGDGADKKVRAAKLDEALEVLAALMSGAPVKHQGAHYNIDCAAFQRPVQQPRVPIWVGGAWPGEKALARAARWDGAVLTAALGLELEPEAIAAIAAGLRARRGGAAFDLVKFGKSAGPNDAALARASAEAGATWWLDYAPPVGGSLEQIKARLRLGPPRL